MILRLSRAIASVTLMLILLFNDGSTCKPPGVSDHVKIGRETYVCVSLGPLSWNQGNATGTYLRTASKFPADEFSTITIKDSWTSPFYKNDTLLKKLNIESEYGEGLAVSVESMGVLSYQKLYRSVESRTSPNQTVTHPLLLAVINVDQGIVKSISWDDSCKWCDSKNCVYNTYDYSGNIQSKSGKSCYVKDDDCIYGAVNGTSVSNNLCQMKVYVTWTGTDINGYYFKSAAGRFSRITTNQIVDFTQRQKEESAQT